MEDNYSPGAEQFTYLFFAIVALVLAIHLLYVYSKNPEKVKKDPMGSLKIIAASFIISIVCFLFFFLSFYSNQ